MLLAELEGDLVVVAIALLLDELCERHCEQLRGESACELGATLAAGAFVIIPSVVNVARCRFLGAELLCDLRHTVGTLR